MSKYLLLIIVVLSFFQCTGEVSSLWIIEWKISPSDQFNFHELKHSFAITTDDRIATFKSNIDDSGNLYDQITIYGYNFEQLEDMQPSFQFKLFSDSLIFIDTIFAWNEMAFDGNVSKKEIVVP